MSKRILLFMGSYLPGTKSAGVTTSVSNMVKELYPDVEFYILTEDRDIGDEKPYVNVPLETWTKYDEANVFYSRKYISSMNEMVSIVNSIDFDAYYFNGFYNIKDNLRPFYAYWKKLIPQKPIVIAPRGIFSMGEYDNKRLLRWFYRLLFKSSGLASKVFWHTTSKLEKDDVLKYFYNASDRITIIPNISGIDVRPRSSYVTKKNGELKILFISRISGKKNIKFILETVQKVKGNITLDFYGMTGTEDDEKYWSECKDIINKFPKNITCVYHGVINHSDVEKVYKDHHLFFFPTFGENYGHVIAESLAFGCPILLSDTTPWNMLDEYNAGWNIPLADEGKYIDALQHMIDIGQDDWNIMSDGAYKIAEKYIDKKNMIDSYRSFFEAL